jgi:hypothetical protein
MYPAIIRGKTMFFNQIVILPGNTKNNNSSRRKFSIKNLDGKRTGSLVKKNLLSLSFFILPEKVKSVFLPTKPLINQLNNLHG